MVLARQSATGYPVLPSVSNESHGSNILAITGTFTALACLVVILRLYVRAIMLKTMGADDYTMILAMVCSIFVFVSFVVEVHLGMGKHMGNPELLANLKTVMHWSWFHAWILVVGISSVKISVGFFLLRLVQTPGYKRFIIAWISFLVAFTIACVGTLIFQCIPVSAAWNLESKSSAKCYSSNVYRSIGLFNGAINIFTDFVFATLPLPVIWPLQMNKRTKISLICVLSLGYFACAAAIVKEVLLSGFFTDPDFSFNDSYQVWNDIEITAGILAACLPALRPFFTFLLDTASSLTHRSATRGTAGASHPRHRYYMQEDDIKLSSLRSHSSNVGKSGYGVTVTGGGSGTDPERAGGWRSPQRMKANSVLGPRGILEQSLEEESGSEENILAAAQREQNGIDTRKGGIVRTTTTEVHIS